MHAVVEFMLNQPGMIERLLSIHQADTNGRCRGCTTPGTGTPSAAWPCKIAGLVQVANKAGRLAVDEARA